MLLIINSFTYPLSSLTDMLLPQYVHAVDHWLTLPQLGEMWFMLWLLIKGAIPKPSPVCADTVTV